VKGLTSIKTLGPSQMTELIDRASAMRDAVDRGVRFDTLAGSTVALAFFEPSTRTRLSFDLAAQRLAANVLTFDPDRSSTAKGESLRDTVTTLAAIGADVLVVRHAEEGIPEAVAGWTGLPVVNAGDGANEHPTQALLDAVTIHRHFGEIGGLRVAVVGDLVHSRVAGSLIHVLSTLGADVVLVGPEAWLPESDSLPMSSDLDAVLPDVDVVYLLRVQTERGGEVSPEYVQRFQLDLRRAAGLPGPAVIMHPGPMNRGVEIADEVASSPRSLVTEQVRNGVPTRMVVLAEIVGAS
jgi:aspartate carbamoyltransferase catalytic subunit